MADQKISELNAKTTVHDTDLFPMVDIEAETDETKKITGENMKAQMIAGHKDLTSSVHWADADGILTFSQQSACRAYLSGGDQVCATAAWLQVKLITENFDIQGEFNNSQATSTATAGTTGTTLKDSTNPFVEGDVGKSVWNNVDGKSTTIAAYVAADQVTLTADIGLASTESYTFGYSRFTAKVAGIYLVSAMVNLITPVDQQWIIADVRKNGSTTGQAVMPASGTASVAVSLSNILSLAANDYLELWAYQDAGSAKNINDGTAATFLAVCKLA